MSEPASRTPTGPGRVLYIVFGLLGLTVTVHLIALAYVFSAGTDVVREDYYEHGEAWDAELAAVAAGKERGLAIALAPAADGWHSGAVAVISLSAAGAAPKPPGGLLVLRKPDDASLDRALPMATPETAGDRIRWRLPLQALKPGIWRLRAEILGEPAMVIDGRFEAGGAEIGR